MTYFSVLNDYGFRPTSLFFFAFKKGIVPASQDYYNPYDTQFKGNSRAFIKEYSDLLGLYGDSYNAYVESKASAPDWNSDSEAHIDLRLYFPFYPNSFWGQCHYDSRGQGFDDYVCYRIEALRHSQGAFLLTGVIMQIANAFVWRTKVASCYTHKMNNHNLHFAFLIEFALIMIIIYVPGLNTAFGTRPLRIEHFFPALGFHITHFFYGEITKLLIRHSHKPDGSPGFFNEYFNY